MKEVIIYADGCCKGNPGNGGYGAILEYNGHRKEIFDGEKNTTNNRMELLAAIAGLESLKESPVRVTLHTDSKYVVDGLTTWIKNWKKNGWKTSSKGQVKNLDLWKRLDEVAGRHVVELVWVKGHNGDPGNERADELANLGYALTRDSQ